MREPGSSKGTDGRDKRRSAGREGFFDCPRPGPHPWATPDPVLPERGCQVQAGRRGTAGTERTEGQESPALCIAALASGRTTFRGTCRPALHRLPRSNCVPPVLPRVAEAKSIKIRTLLTLPCWGGRSRSMLSPYIVGVECRLHLRGSLPVSPLPYEAPCPLLSYCGKPAGLWAPASRSSSDCLGRDRCPAHRQAVEDSARLKTGPGGCLELWEWIKQGWSRWGAGCCQLAPARRARFARVWGPTRGPSVGSSQSCEIPRG